MRHEKYLAAITMAAGLTLALTSCFGSSQPVATPKPAASNVSDPSANPTSSTGTQTPLPTPTVTNFTPSADPLSADGYFEYARVLFPNAQATKNYTKDQVLLGLYTAYLYGQQAQDDPYFISGQWAKEGYPQLAVNTRLGEWYTDRGTASLLTNVGKIKTDVKSGQDVFSAFNFLPVGGSNYTVCAATARTCQEEGYPKIVGNMTFKETDTGRLLVAFTAENRISMTIDGKDGYLPVTKKITLFLTKNDSYKGEIGTYPFLIDGWSTSVDRSGFTS